MTGTSFDLSAIRTDATDYKATFRALIEALSLAGGTLSINAGIAFRNGTLTFYDSDGTTIRVVYGKNAEPGNLDDITQGYVAGSRWYHTDGRVFECNTNTETSAVWDDVTPATLADIPDSGVTVRDIDGTPSGVFHTIEFTNGSVSVEEGSEGVVRVTLPGAQDLSDYLTSATAASTYQPLDSDLTAIAALSTTSTGRGLLTESTTPTGTGALVRAASPTLTGTLNAESITASGIASFASTNATINSSGSVHVKGQSGQYPLAVFTSDGATRLFDVVNGTGDVSTQGTFQASTGFRALAFNSYMGVLFSSRFVFTNSSIDGYSANDTKVIAIENAGVSVTGNITASGTVGIGAAARFTEQTYTPSGTTQTINLNNGNLNTLSLGSTTGNLTLALTVPASAASGRIKIIQHGTTARGITIALSAGTAVWYSAIPAWSSQATGKKTILSYSWDGTDMSLSAVEAV